MNDLEGVRYEVDGGIARITLARPGHANAFDLPTSESLGRAVDAAASDEAVRVLLLTADGPRFCAGGDVSSMAAAEDRPAYLKQLADTLDGVFQHLDRIEKPVVAGVQGVVAGAGLALVLSADIVVSARSTRYLTAYAGVGLTPDCGLSWLLPRAVGQQRALELLLTGRVLAAEEARDWGLVTTVVDDETLVSEANGLADRVCEAPPFALGQARRLVRGSWHATRAEAGADEARTIARAVATPEAYELVQRFAK